MLQQVSCGAMPSTSPEPGTNPPTASPGRPAPMTVQPSERPTSRVPTQTDYSANRVFLPRALLRCYYSDHHSETWGSKPCQPYGQPAPTAGPHGLSFRDQTFGLLGHSGRMWPAGPYPDSEITSTQYTPKQGQEGQSPRWANRQVKFPRGRTRDTSNPAGSSGKLTAVDAGAGPYSTA